MSRSGYIDDFENWAMVRWRGAVSSAIRGKRGQQLLRELAEAMDAMPKKRLIANSLKQDGDYCALGVVGSARGLELEGIDPEESEEVAKVFDIADALAREIVFMNDEGTCLDETPEERWQRMRTWVEQNLQEVPA